MLAISLKIILKKSNGIKSWLRKKKSICILLPKLKHHMTHEDDVLQVLYQIVTSNTSLTFVMRFVK